MSKKTVGIIGCVVVLTGITAYFITEAITLYRRNKKEKALKNEIKSLEETTTLIDVDDSESKEIVCSSLKAEQEKVEIIEEKKYKQKSRIRLMCEGIFHLAPAVLRFFGDLIISDKDDIETRHLGDI
jgi:hypothetical protein